MRDIKFRAWDGMRIVPWEELRTDICSVIEEDKYWKVMQYTGLKDDEGTEIYEGDIIQSSFGIPGLRVLSDVKYDGSAFMISTPKYTPKECTLAKAIEYLGNVYVIGNIYENPELLNEV